MRGSRNEGEENLLRRIRAALGRRSSPNLRERPASTFLTSGMGDDAALARPTSGNELILTCDWFLEGTHFLREKHPADSIGWKCLARAVSDVAAMGGVPRCFLLSLALPRELTGPWMNKFLGGLRRAARAFRCELAGGDTTKRREILINVTVVGEIAEGKAVLRSGARPGDIVYVSGRLGEAEFGLQQLRTNKELTGKRGAILKKHLYPQPRLALGQWLAEKRLATAMMDLSDGLSSDLRRLCHASNVGGSVKADCLPMLRHLAGSGLNSNHGLQLALHGGDDYELLFTVKKKDRARIPRAYKGVPLTAIGEITKGKGLLLTLRDGRSSPLKPGGWDPFTN
jgi:thiamine-monophosphate kinase